MHSYEDLELRHLEQRRFGLSFARRHISRKWIEGKLCPFNHNSTKQYSASLTSYTANILDSIHSFINTMATALPSGDKAPVVSFCEPQPTVTFYTTGLKSSNSQEKVVREPLPSPASASGSLAAQSTSESETPTFVIHKHLICHHSPFFPLLSIAISRKELLRRWP